MGKKRKPKPGQKLVDGLWLHEDGFWRFRFMSRGQLYTGNTRTADQVEAREFLKDLKAKIRLVERGCIALEEPPVPEEPPHSITLAELVDEWEATKAPVCARSHVQPTVNSIRTHFPDMLGKAVCDLTEQDCNKAIGTYLETKGRNPGRGGKPVLRDHTKRGARALLKRLRDVISWGIKAKKVREFPFEISYPQPNEVRRHSLDLDQVDRFFQLVDRVSNPHQGLAVHLMLLCGLREAEALHTSWEGISWKEGRLYPNKTKTADGQGVTLPPALREYLEHHPLRKAFGLMLPSCHASDPGEGVPYRAGFTARVINWASWVLAFEALESADQDRILSRIERLPDTDLQLLTQLVLLLGITETMGRAIRWSDINLERKEIRIVGPDDETWTEKLPERLVRLIGKVPANRREGRIVSASMGRHKGNGVFKHGEAMRALAKMWKELGLPRLTPHRLRASFATIHASKFHTHISKIQEMMRHAHIETTVKYIDVNYRELQDAQAKWPSLSGKRSRGKEPSGEEE